MQRQGNTIGPKGVHLFAQSVHTPIHLFCLFLHLHPKFSGKTEVVFFWGGGQPDKPQPVNLACVSLSSLTVGMGVGQCVLPGVPLFVFLYS